MDITPFVALFANEVLVKSDADLAALLNIDATPLAPVAELDIDGLENTALRRTLSSISAGNIAIYCLMNSSDCSFAYSIDFLNTGLFILTTPSLILRIISSLSPGSNRPEL